MERIPHLFGFGSRSGQLAYSANRHRRGAAEGPIVDRWLGTFALLPSELRVHVWRFVLQDFLMDPLGMSCQCIDRNMGYLPPLTLLRVNRVLAREVIHEANAIRHLRIHIGLNGYTIKGFPQHRIHPYRTRNLMRFHTITFCIRPAENGDPGQLYMLMQKLGLLLKWMQKVRTNYRIVLQETQHSSWYCGLGLKTSFTSVRQLVRKDPTTLLYIFLEEYLAVELSRHGLGVDEFYSDACLVILLFRAIHHPRSLYVTVPRRFTPSLTVFGRLWAAVKYDEYRASYRLYGNSTTPPRTVSPQQFVHMVDNLLMILHIALDTMQGPTAALWRIIPWTHRCCYDQWFFQLIVPSRWSRIAHDSMAAYHYRRSWGSQVLGMPTWTPAPPHPVHALDGHLHHPWFRRNFESLQRTYPRGLPPKDHTHRVAGDISSIRVSYCTLIHLVRSRHTISDGEAWMMAMMEMSVG